MLKLSVDEQTWLDEYRKALKERHAGVVVRMVIYGSKARGDAQADSDLQERLRRPPYAAISAMTGATFLRAVRSSPVATSSIGRKGDFRSSGPWSAMPWP